MVVKSPGGKIRVLVDLLRTIKEIASEIGVDVVGNVTERWVSAQLSTWARKEFIAYIINLLRRSGEAARFPGEDYISPSEGLSNIGSLLELAAELSIINPELAETITEGVSDDLMTALQHVTTEPIERWFSTLFGAENLDSDDVTEAYAWGLIPPEMMAWLLAVSGVSNSAAAAAMTKALGEKYSGNFRAISDIGSRYGYKSLDIDIDWLDKAYSEIRSALFGIPEAVRTQYNDFIAEVNRLYTQALRKASQALVLYRTGKNSGDANLQAQYTAKAELLLAEAEAYLDVAATMSSIMTDYVSSTQDVLATVIDQAVNDYQYIRSEYINTLCRLVNDVVSLSVSTENEMMDEYKAFSDALKSIRGISPPGYEAPGGGGGEAEEPVLTEAEPNYYQCACVG